jgi:AraC-like DNA-binding protein
MASAIVLECAQLPVVERVRLGFDFVELSGPALFQVGAGEVHVLYGDRERCRADVGDLLLLGPDIGCRLGGRRREARGVLFRATPGWNLRARALAELEPREIEPQAVVVRGNSAASRRARRLLHDLLTGEGSTLRRAARWLELLDFILEAHSDGPAGARRPGGGRRAALFEALEKLESEPLDDIRLGDFAARIGASERQASRLLRREIGKSFGQHLTDLRTARAAELLARTDQPVVELAGRAGFGSLSHFNAVFRDRTGLTPSEFRQRSRDPSWSRSA